MIDHRLPDGGAPFFDQRPRSEQQRIRREIRRVRFEIDQQEAVERDHARFIDRLEGNRHSTQPQSSREALQQRGVRNLVSPAVAQATPTPEPRGERTGSKTGGRRTKGSVWPAFSATREAMSGMGGQMVMQYIFIKTLAWVLDMAGLSNALAICYSYIIPQLAPQQTDLLLLIPVVFCWHASWLWAAAKMLRPAMKLYCVDLLALLLGLWFLLVASYKVVRGWAREHEHECQSSFDLVELLVFGWDEESRG